MRVDPIFAFGRNRGAGELSRELGLRWVHGLIELERYSRGEVYLETRGPEWDESFGAGSVSEDQARWFLLEAIERADRAEMLTGRIEGIEADAIADVLGLPTRTLRGVLAGLIVEGLAEGRDETFGRSAIDGAVRITQAGVAALKLFRERAGSRPGPLRSLQTVMFTDIVGSTGQLASVGDDQWRNLIRQHNQLTHDLVDQFGGRVVKLMRDGALVVFDLPGPAVKCAIALRSRLSGIDISIRSGVHIGEIDIVDGNVSGLAVNVAARLLDVASAGEICVTEALREMALGSGTLFTPIGRKTLRDIPGDWLVYVAAIQDDAKLSDPPETPH